MSRAKEKSVLGSSELAAAVQAIDLASKKTVATMAHYGHTRAQTLRMLFAHEDLEALEKVRDTVAPALRFQDYPMSTMGCKDDASLRIDYTGALVPPISVSALVRPGTRNEVLALCHYVNEVAAIHWRFERLKAVVRWLDKNASRPAFRYYLPSISALCPSMPCGDAVPKNFTTPYRVHAWLPIIREATTTIAQMALLPSDIVALKPSDSDLALKFASATNILIPAEVSYTTDPHIYAIR